MGQYFGIDEKIFFRQKFVIKNLNAKFNRSKRT